MGRASTCGYTSGTVGLEIEVEELPELELDPESDGDDDEEDPETGDEDPLPLPLPLLPSPEAGDEDPCCEALKTFVPVRTGDECVDSDEGGDESEEGEDEVGEAALSCGLRVASASAPSLAAISVPVSAAPSVDDDPARFVGSCSCIEAGPSSVPSRTSSLSDFLLIHRGYCCLLEVAKWLADNCLGTYGWIALACVDLMLALSRRC